MLVGAPSNIAGASSNFLFFQNDPYFFSKNFIKEVLS